MNHIDTEKGKNAGLSFEEINVINDNLDDFEVNGIAHDLDESFERINTTVFSKYSVKSV